MWSIGKCLPSLHNNLAFGMSSSVARFFYQWVVNNARPKHIQILWALKWKLIHWDIFYCDFVVVGNVHTSWAKDLFEIPSPRETLNSSASYFGFRNVGFCDRLSGSWDFYCLWNGLLSVIKRQLAAVFVFQSFTPIGLHIRAVFAWVLISNYNVIVLPY